MSYRLWKYLSKSSRNLSLSCLMSRDVRTTSKTSRTLVLKVPHLLNLKHYFLESILWYESDGSISSHVRTIAYEPQIYENTGRVETAPQWDISLRVREHHYSRLAVCAPGSERTRKERAGRGHVRPAPFCAAVCAAWDLSGFAPRASASSKGGFRGWVPALLSMVRQSIAPHWPVNLLKSVTALS